MINYYLLTKPGIVLGNLVTVAAGFMLASRDFIDFWLFLATLSGLAGMMASGCALNNYIDRPIDKKMTRTQNRVLVQGLISGKKALFFAAVLGIIGSLTLLFFTNLLTLCIAGLGFFIYVVPYSLWKGRTVYGTAIGSLAGAVPPVVGYCAVRNQFDLGAFILFMMMVLWQMPHFFAIAIYHLRDYTEAKIPVLPVVQGPTKAKIRSLIYITAFIATSSLLTVFHYTGFLYFAVASISGGIWLLIGLKDLTNNDHKQWGYQMFLSSLFAISTICIMILYDRL